MKRTRKKPKDLPIRICWHVCHGRLRWREKRRKRGPGRDNSSEGAARRRQAKRSCWEEMVSLLQRAGPIFSECRWTVAFALCFLLVSRSVCVCVCPSPLSLAFLIGRRPPCRLFQPLSSYYISRSSIVRWCPFFDLIVGLNFSQQWPLLVISQS